MQLVIFLAAVPGFLIAFYAATVQRGSEKAKIRQAASQIAGLVALEEQRTMEGSRQLLVSLTHMSEIRNRNSSRCHAALLGILNEHSHLYANLGVARTDGAIWCSAVLPPRSINIADRGYFRQALRARQFSTGSFQISLITGRPGLDFGYPVTDASGDLRGVIFGELDLARFGRLDEAVEVRMPMGATVTKFDENGIILAMQPAMPGIVGRPLPNLSFFQAHLKNGIGLVTAKDVFGISRVYAFSRVLGRRTGNGIYVVLSIPEDLAYEPVERILALFLSALGLITIVAIITTSVLAERVILNPVARLLSTTRRLTEGELSARTGLRYSEDEIGGLARALDEMAEARERHDADLRRLSSRLLRTQDAERRRIARELHDSTAQTLAALAMNLSVLHGYREKLDRTARTALTQATKMADECLQETRTMSYLLHPPLIDEIGLVSALKWYAETLTQRTQMRVVVRVSPNFPRLRPEIEIALYRVAQEALSNVHRHSGCSAAQIELQKEEGTVTLAVIDHGSGFPLERVGLGGRSYHSGVGIASMRERVRQLGGTLDLQSGSSGTIVKATIPLQETNK